MRSLSMSYGLSAMPSSAKLSTPLSGMCMKPDASMIDGVPTPIFSIVGLPCVSSAASNLATDAGR
jgi:hypothetical protein